MAFRVAFTSIGSTDISDDDFKGIYEEGTKYLKSEPNYGASGVTYFNEKVYEGFDVISLNGSLNSIKRMKPKSYSYTEDSFKIEKSRMFKFDNTGINPLNRHVYASFDSLVNLNKGNPSKLAYDLLLKDIGTITVKFKIDTIDSVDKARTILYSEKDGIQKMKIFVSGERIIFQTSIDGTCHDVGGITKEKWNFVSIRYSGGNYQIQVEENMASFNDSYLNLDNTWTYIGCSVDQKKKPINHLNGCMEMLSFKDKYASDAEISNIMSNGSSISVRTYYDELGRTSVKKIHSKNNTISKQLTYKNNGTYTTTRIQNEQDYSGKIIEYDYDELGQIKNIKTTGNGINDVKQYQYDGLSRLIGSTINGATHSYSYDANNNIKTKDGVIYYYDTEIKDRLLSCSDGTSILYNDNFIGNPTTIVKPNKTMNLSWNGRRLNAINDYSYNYNQNSVRIGKTASNKYTEKYFLEGDRISVLKRVENGIVDKLSFIYDEAQMLVGFSYNSNEYFYDRSVTGEINSIIDSDGKVIVRYAYDDWGRPVDIDTDDSIIGNRLKEINPFMYKGYFYDQEFGLYYLKSRYYDPELGRFISADSEVGSIGNTMGMNLYAYCKCNPINYADENGNWPSWATKVCIGLAVIAVCAIIAVATAGTGLACMGMSMLVGAAEGAAIGAVEGAVTGAVIGAVTEGIKTGSWDGALKGAISGAVNGAADGFMFGAIGGAVSGGLNSKFCFVAGTLVMTKQGYKAIEEIKKGDQVLSFNSNLGIYDYKDVVDVYVNETSELCHIKTKNDEILCTPNHSILTEKGWMLARDINTGDNIKTKDGITTVVSIQIETSTEKIKVYNFNVLGYHTYVIGNELAVVHNNCASSKSVEPTERHHIVEQCQSKPTRSGFNMSEINKNTIDIPKSTHHKVSALYSSKGTVKGVDYASKLNIDTGGKTIRNWLNNQSFESQLEFGKKVLNLFGVKI